MCGFVLYGGSFRSTPPLSKAVEAKVEFEERWFLSKVLFLDLLFNCFDHPLVKCYEKKGFKFLALENSKVEK